MRGFVRIPPSSDRKPDATRPRPQTPTPKPQAGPTAQARHHLARRLANARSDSAREAWSAATSGGAAPLPHRQRMEPLFGRGFSKVRAFLGRAEALARLGAKAATDGQRVAFASSSPSPRQVAHELAHVVQMGRSGGVGDGSRLSEPGSPAELEADRVAERVGRGGVVSPVQSAPAALHRDIKQDRLEVPHGFFKIDMTKIEAAGGWSGESGTIHYEPKTTAPDTDSIKLTQVAEVKNCETNTEWKWKGTKLADLGDMQTVIGDRVHVTVKGDTLDKVSTLHFGSKDKAKDIGVQNSQLIGTAAPDALKDTSKPLPTGLTLEICYATKPGYFVDIRPDLPHATKRKYVTDPIVAQDYIQPDPRWTSDPKNKHGKKKGKVTDEASIFDFPHLEGNGHIMWSFETVARSDDIGLYYGTLAWQFRLDATGSVPVVKDEDFAVKPGATDTFRSAVVEFNRFYLNTHTVMKGQTLREISRLYFGNADKADDIFKENAELIGKPDGILKPGWELRIPGVSATKTKS